MRLEHLLSGAAVGMMEYGLFAVKKTAISCASFCLFFIYNVEEVRREDAGPVLGKGDD